jgi:RNA polymerase sigma-70 factor (ECF subfamily)
VNTGLDGAADAELEAAVPRLLRAARAMGHPPEEAEDLVHDVLVDHLRARAGFRRDCALYTWLYGILVRRHVDLLRRKRPVKPVSADVPPPASPAEADERARGVQEAVDTLDEPYATVLRLRFFGGFAYEEIARLLAAPVGTVKSQVFHGLQKLRGALERRFGLSAEEVL